MSCSHSWTSVQLYLVMPSHWEGSKLLENCGTMSTSLNLAQVYYLYVHCTLNLSFWSLLAEKYWQNIPCTSYLTLWRQLCINKEKCCLCWWKAKRQRQLLKMWKQSRAGLAVSENSGLLLWLPEPGQDEIQLFRATLIRIYMFTSAERACNH